MPAWYDQITPKFVQNVAVLYLQQTKFEAFSMFPVLPVAQRSGYIAVYKKEDWLRIGDIDAYKRWGAVESVGDDYELDKQSYTVVPYAFHKDIAKEDREEYDNPFDPVRDATMYVINRLRLVFASNFVSSFLNTGIWSFEKQGGAAFTQWDDTSSDPVGDVLSFKGEVKALTGFEPNRMLITHDVYVALRKNQSIKDQLKVTDHKVITLDVLARLMDLEEIVVLDAVRTTAKKGETATTSNTGFLASKKALLVFAPARASKLTPSAGYHITLRRNGQNIATRRIPMPHLNDALRIEGEMAVDCKVVAPDLGVYMYDVIS